MGYSRSRWTQALWIPALLAQASLASAFTLNTDRDTLSGWDTDLLSIDYNYSDCPAGVSHDSLNGALDSAISLWNGVPTSRIRLQRGSEVTTTADSAATRKTGGNPVVACDKNFGTRVQEDANVVPALTVDLLLEGGENRIVYGAVLLNSQTSASANIGSVAISRLTFVLAHELGHLLGLGHSPDSNALMYFDLTDKSVLSLSQDDMEGMAYLYPRRELMNAKAFGCGSISSIPGSNSSRRDGGTGEGQGLLSFFVFCSYFVAFWMHRQFARAR